MSVLFLGHLRVVVFLAVGIFRFLFVLLRIVFFFVFLFFFFGCFFFFALVVIARGEGRDHVLAESHGNELPGVRVNPGVVEITIDRGEFAAGLVVQVFAVGVEHGVAVVIVAAGDLVAFGFLDVVERDGGVLVVEIQGIGQPTAVPGPGYLEAVQVPVIEPELLADFAGLFLVDVMQVKAHGVVNKGNLFAVGRPLWAVAETVGEGGKRLLGAGAIRRAQCQLILAGAVAEVGDVFAVRRPGGIAFGHP